MKRHVYSLPSIHLHAAAGFPVKETWIDAIKYGNFVTWPGLTTMTIRKHFPDSDESQQGHMKNSAKELDQQGQKLTQTKKERTRKKCHQRKCKMCISKSTMPVKQCIPINQDASRQCQAKETNTSWC
jgi:hypothetical protein